MKISEYFKLGVSQRELDFVDINIYGDIALFLNPHHISLMQNEHAEDAIFCIQTFFDSLLNLIKMGDMNGAKTLLSYIGENNEIHLGYSRGTSRGRGIGDLNSDDLLNSLASSRAVEEGLIEKLEDCNLFINGIAEDKISDLSSHVIRKVLLDYTIEQCELWGIPLEEAHSGNFWDPNTKSWRSNFRKKRLVIKGKPYLLVPKQFVTFKYDYAPHKYRQHFVLNFLQEKHLKMGTSLVQVRRDKKGNIIKYVTKSSIKEDFEKKEIVLNKEWLLQFSLDNKDVFKKFKEDKPKVSKDFFHEYSKELTIDEICNTIIQMLIKMPSGPNHSQEYEKIVKSATQLLFYPDLVNPVMGDIINEGRKIIDITYSNTSEEGVFAMLRDQYDIPCMKIMIECKNYSKDIANPELDQMIGRFSNNRGKVGLIFCRSLDNSELFTRRCQDTYKDKNEVIIHITDDILKYLLENYKNYQVGSYNKILLPLIKKVIGT